ncbi:MAG TPA: heme ABC exporter ATP-binding protein CcmA [Holosporales bacterium]|nr:heme ABC exporter ATP-binding protein CcmA [Holosporales bacterium]HBW25354.1 heme ABC exporter ATP-binding protein CcmA [Holosporales bacterium]HCC24311.1 heme ABC exporter ATP-binding protein CcmA [Holosporales bacterium]HCE96024.1 heme ABC exporter ATP-binding protein CcmA [Holosporales bacterium]
MNRSIPLKIFFILRGKSTFWQSSESVISPFSNQTVSIKVHFMLEARHITFAPLFSDLSFSLRQKETLLVRGANGAGKSTFLRILAGLIRLKPNPLFWKGEAVHLSTYQQNLLYVGHKLALHPEALLKDQIKLWQYHTGVKRDTIEKALDLWGVASLFNKKIDQLSQGQRKRISLSRCQWLPRPLWILDEPHTSLDEAGLKVLEKALCDHREKGGLVILATHEKKPKGTQEILL